MEQLRIEHIIQSFFFLDKAGEMEWIVWWYMHPVSGLFWHNYSGSIIWCWASWRLGTVVNVDIVVFWVLLGECQYFRETYGVHIQGNAAFLDHVPVSLSYVPEWLSTVKGKKVKVKVTLVQALRLCTGRTAHMGSRGIALLFHDHGTTRGWGVSVTPWLLFTPGKDPVPIVQEAGWAPGPVWTGAEILAPHRDLIPGPSSP